MNLQGLSFKPFIILSGKYWLIGRHCRACIVHTRGDSRRSLSLSNLGLCCGKIIIKILTGLSLLEIFNVTLFFFSLVIDVVSLRVFVDAHKTWILSHQISFFGLRLLLQSWINLYFLVMSSSWDKSFSIVSSRLEIFLAWGIWCVVILTWWSCHSFVLGQIRE